MFGFELGKVSLQPGDRLDSGLDGTRELVLDASKRRFVKELGNLIVSLDLVERSGELLCCSLGIHERLRELLGRVCLLPHDLIGARRHVSKGDVDAAPLFHGGLGLLDCLLLLLLREDEVVLRGIQIGDGLHRLTKRLPELRADGRVQELHSVMHRNDGVTQAPQPFVLSVYLLVRDAKEPSGSAALRVDILNALLETRDVLVDGANVDRLDRRSADLSAIRFLLAQVFDERDQANLGSFQVDLGIVHALGDLLRQAGLSAGITRESGNRPCVLKQRATRLLKAARRLL